MNGKALVCLFVGSIMALLAALMIFTGELNVSGTQMQVGGTVQEGRAITFESNPVHFSVMLTVFSVFALTLIGAAIKLWRE